MQQEVDFARAAARKQPEELAIAIARDVEGKFNPITLGWCMRTSHDPPLFAISIGETRYSLEVMRFAREFTLALPSARMAEETLYFGEHSGRHLDKLVMTQSNVTAASRIDSVILDHAVANFECVLESELETGDHVLFVGRVVCSHVNRDGKVKRLFRLDSERHLGALSRG